MKKQLKNKSQFQSGQVLLITVMLLATVITVVLSLSFKSTTETKITKLEEESQKALAAAEGAIEASLKSGGSTTFGAGNLSSITNFTGGATISTATSHTFSTPLLQKDEQYTFYLGSYDPSAGTIGASVAEAITICFTSPTVHPVLEITLVKQAGITARYVVDPDSPARINNAVGSEGACPLDPTDYPYSFTVPAADISTNTKLLIVRELFAGGKLFFTRSSNFPLQGKTINSEAQSTTGVAKTVQLFQSYPQIPSDFFVTSF